MDESGVRPAPPLRVVKLGGSLLTSAGIFERVTAWLASQPAARTRLVVGGGAPIDEIARRQREEGFDDRTAHWLCIRAMQANAAAVAGRLDGFWYDEYRYDEQMAHDRAVVDPWTFMQSDARGTKPLPEAWSVTSDSIAARLAETLHADELVLFKSALPADAANPGDYVDPCFSVVADHLKSIRFVNLGDRAFREFRYR